MKIGVFDSGVGGLTVLKELVKNFKGEFVYFADLKNSPYGEKSEEELKDILFHILDKFIEMKVDIIVIACGTLSSIAIKNNVDIYKGVKVVNIITSIKDYLQEVHYSNLILLATKATIAHGNFKREIQGLADTFFENGCGMFVPYIESGKLSNEKSVEIVREYITQEMLALDKENTAIILGCTHYPILKEAIMYVSKVKNIILPPDATVAYIKKNNLIKDNVKCSLEVITNKKTEFLLDFVKSNFSSEILVKQVEM